MSGLTSEASVESAGTPAPEGTRRRAHRPSVDGRARRAVPTPHPRALRNPPARVTDDEPL